ncbi:MAG: hypothetical protein IJR00_08045 [Lachnospiraceae bacterium]|nr:hypothetical protein [Lachnospiraceae bacterium]
MSRKEVEVTRYGEMIDMISCLSIYNGGAQEKEKKKKWTFEEVMALR